MSKENAIEVVSLTKKFGDFTAVDNISFSVSKGEIFGFLGANGAGKTTAMKMLCGLSRPTSGDAVVAGYDINTNPGKVTTFGGNKCPMSLRTGKIPLKNQFVYRKFHGIGIRIPICCHFSQRWKAISGRKLIRFKLFAQITRQLDMKPYIPRRNKIAKFFGRYLFHEYLLYFCTCEINYTTFYKKKQYQY